MQKRYPDDLTDEEWVLIHPLLPTGPRGQGRKPKYTRREMLNAIFYVLRTGCSWRHIPADFPPWRSVYDLFRRYRIRGVFEKIHHRLRRGLRQLAKRAAEPNVGIVDSQSVKTTEKEGFVGLTGARRLKVGKDTYWLITGLISEVVVSAANCNDRDGLRLIVDRMANPCSVPKLIYADHGYTGEPLKEWVESRGSALEIVGRAKGVDSEDGKVKTVEKFVLLPKRWIVERTFGWLGRMRRLSKDYEYYPSSSESWIYLSMIRLMVRRTAGGNFDF